MTSTRTLEQWIAAAWRDRPACPPPEIFLEPEWRALEPATREAIEAHAVSCAGCAAERELAGAWDRASGAPSARDQAGLAALLERVAPPGPAAEQPSAGQTAGESAGPPGGARVLRFPRVLARLAGRPALGLAAAAMVVLVAGLVARSRLAPPALPQAPVHGVVRGGTVELVDPVGEISRIPERLVWRAIDGAARYRVTLTAFDESVLLRTTVAETEMELPVEIRTRLDAAVVYRWFVEALDGAGATLALSPSTAFQAAPPPDEERR